jgi:hypothetical protein
VPVGTRALAEETAGPRAIRQRASYEINKSRDEVGIGIRGRQAKIARHAQPHRQIAVFHVQFHQCLGMLRDEGDRHDKHGNWSCAARSISASVLGSSHFCGVARD